MAMNTVDLVVRKEYNNMNFLILQEYHQIFSNIQNKKYSNLWERKIRYSKKVNEKIPPSLETKGLPLVTCKFFKFCFCKIHHFNYVLN